MGKEGKKGRYEDFLLKFNKVDAEKSTFDSCNLGGSFNFCVSVTNQRNGNEKKYYFDESEGDNIPRIIGNYDKMERNGRFSVKIFNKDGKLTSEWEKKS